MEVEPWVPPGFRFHPTEEELVGYYLTRKVASEKIDLEVIADVDLYRIEPWDLQDRCKLGHEDQNEWYFFSHKDKKYPTGTRTNRATAAGFWKATGRDKAVLSKNKIIGMRKTLVFYQGRAPNGRKTDWIMHEYRLQTSEHAPTQEEGWVVCRAFRKQNTPTQRQSFGGWNHGGIRLLATAEITRHGHLLHPFGGGGGGGGDLHDQEDLELKLPYLGNLLESPPPSASLAEQFLHPEIAPGEDALVDWKVLDKLARFSDHPALLLELQLLLDPLQFRRR
ncbi:unnamed protein product [Spirodela intermedia]|uniref:NAC domain-containing protein n=1 Tax=Spirodela intermedia TaxID=51605 RepID=A0A7I8ITY9_SPIIN|nr:unnamed protein product [Spirodela intermedia]CAA6660598.1 unnamed protein product [Spirodela intermedia]